MTEELDPVRRYRRTEFALGAAALLGTFLTFLLGFVPTTNLGETAIRYVGAVISGMVVAFAAYRLGTLRAYRPEDEA